MSSSYRGGGGSGPNMTGGSSSAAIEAQQRARYMAHMERRARPPTFRPLTIVVVVLSIGLFIIGLIMIVIAHWPGVSGGDPLKIAGGVLMAVGGLVFIIAMVVTCVLRNREQERFEKSVASIAASRSGSQSGSMRYNSNSMQSRHSQVSSIAHSHRQTPRPTPQMTPTPSIDAKPGKSILKKTPSTSTYGTNRGSVFGEEGSDSGVPYNNSFGHDSNQSSDGSAGKYEVYRIETLPDPGLAKRGRNGALPQVPGSGGMNLSGSGLGNLSGMGAGLDPHSSTDSEAQVLPTAVRNTKKRRGQSPSVASGSVSGGGGRHNLSYQPDADEAAAPRGRKMQQYGNDGYDAYDQQPTQQQPAYQQPPPQQPAYQQPSPQQPAYQQPDQNISIPEATASSAQREKRRQRRAKKQASQSSDYANTSAFQNEAFSPPEADLGYQQPPPRRHNTSHNTSRGSVDDELKINIRAQPGTAVHITPTGTRKHQPPRPGTAASQSSVETEI